MSTHGTRSCSQLERNYYCPGSAALIESMGENAPVASLEATEGTIKHRLTNLMVSGEMIDSKPSYDVITTVCEVLDIERRIREEYGEHISREEVPVDLSELGIPFSRESNLIDRLIVIPGRGCVVIDYKYGARSVSPAMWNWQLKGYAYGALKMFGGSWVWGLIIQPSCDPMTSEAVWTADYLESEVGPTIRDIIDRTNKQTDILVRGRQCDFCDAKDICPQHRGVVLGIPKHVTVKQHLNAISPADRSELYEQVKAAKKWLADAQEMIEQCGLEGMPFADHEVGEGRKSRVWKNDGIALEVLSDMAIENNRSVDELLNIITPAQAEALFGKSKSVKENLKSLIEEKPGKPAMVRKKGGKSNGAIR